VKSSFRSAVTLYSFGVRRGIVSKSQVEKRLGREES